MPSSGLNRAFTRQYRLRRVPPHGVHEAGDDEIAAESWRAWCSVPRLPLLSRSAQQPAQSSEVAPGAPPCGCREKHRHRLATTASRHPIDRTSAIDSQAIRAQRAGHSRWVRTKHYCRPSSGTPLVRVFASRLGSASMTQGLNREPTTSIPGDTEAPRARWGLDGCSGLRSLPVLGSGAHS